MKRSSSFRPGTSVSEALRRLAAVLCVCLLLAPVPAGRARSEALSFRVTSIASDDGSAVLSCTRREFEALGFAPGDLIEVRLPDGSSAFAPFVEKLTDAAKGSLCLYAPKKQMRLCLRGQKITSLSVARDDTIALSLFEAGGYTRQVLLGRLREIESRKKSPSDEAFANFRPVLGGSLPEGRLFRSASPCSGTERSAIALRLTEEAGVRWILNLSDAPEDPEAKGLYAQLLSEGRVFFAQMDLGDLTGPDFEARLAASLAFLSRCDGPCLIHCAYGKDRTGVVCALLQALCGADAAWITDDYFLSYRNWYGITREDEAAPYALSLLTEWLNRTLAPDGAADLSSAARAYLLRCGMTDGDVDLLIQYLTGREAPAVAYF